MGDELKLVTKLRNRAINKRAKGHYSPSTIALEDEAADAILALRQRAEQAERERDALRKDAEGIRDVLTVSRNWIDARGIEFRSQNFTDRYGYGDRAKILVAAIDGALAALEHK